MEDICKYYAKVPFRFSLQKGKTQMSKNHYIIIVITILLTSACNHNQQESQQLQYKNMGNTSTPHTSLENMNTNQDYLTEPNNENTTETPIHDGPSQEAFPLFMSDFQQRWNAISDEQTGDLYIHHFQQNVDSNHYLTTLKDKLNMEVSTVDNKRIDRIRIISTSKTNSERLQLLTSWWQVLLITNPKSELNEIDTIFSEMGIGPNSNLEELHAVSFSFGGLQYKVTPSKQGILFEAIYPNPTENPTLQGGT
jgi:hypothetical protein